MAMMVRECRSEAVNWRSDMKSTRAAALAIAAFLGLASANPAHAVPPTATPSPGYDARLQEQRAAASRAYEPAAPVTKPVPPRRTKRMRAN
jgi:hypothetical protein